MATLDPGQLVLPVGAPVAGQQVTRSVAQSLVVMVGDSIKTIVESITDSSISKPYVVYVMAGAYTEAATITVPTYVTVLGMGSVIIDASGNGGNAIALSTGSSVRDIAISGIPTGYAIQGPSTGAAVLEDITIFGCANGILVDNAAASVSVRGIQFIASTALTTGIHITAGRGTFTNISIGGAAAITKVALITGSSSIATLHQMVSTSNPNVVTGIEITSSSRAVLEAIDIVGATTGIVVSGGASAVISCTVFNCGTAISIAGTSSVDLKSAIFEDSTTYDMLVADDPTVKGTANLDTSKLSAASTATMNVLFMDIFPGDEGVTVLGELHVGTPTAPAESTLGEGDSYVQGQLVYTYDGASYVDVSSEAASASGSTFTFPNLNVNSAIYWAATKDQPGGADTVLHHGLKLDIDTAQTGGTVVFEYWNGSAWTTFNIMAADATPPYIPHNGDVFGSTGDHQIRYNIKMVNDNWTKNDDPSIGTSYYWVRARITSTLTVAPVLQQSKLHSSRMEVNGDGWPEFFGNARPIGLLPWDLGLTEAASASPSNQDLFVSDLLDVGRIENKFSNGTTDRIGFTDYLPLELDTSCPITLRLSLITDDASAGNIDFVIRWGYTADGDNVYTSSGSAPTTGPNEQNITTSLAAPTAADTQLTYEFELDVSGMVARRAAGGFGDILWISIQRTAGDTHAGDISMINLKAYYYKWATGGHI